MIGAAAFVAGVAALQLQSMLPSMGALLASALLGALLIAWTVFRPGRRRETFLVMTAVAGLALGFSYAGGRAHLRLADELGASDQGRDVVVTGVVASLPVRLERGVRFEFDVESIEGDVHVPSRLLLGWYATTETVRAGQRWRLSVRLKRPHGAMNPAGFDFEAWMLERNLRATGYVRSGRSDEAPRVLDPMVWRPLLAIERLRGWLRDRLEQRLGTARHGGVL
ncbi:MAG: ComEC/Rec2 family competence protein, partial [Burkholderiaceae bacterium]